MNRDSDHLGSLLKSKCFYEEYERLVAKATGHIRQKIRSFQPEFAMVLGTGLSGLADKIDVECILDTRRIPEYPTLSVKGHKGELIFGWLEGVPIVGLNGRHHYYETGGGVEGSGMLEVVFPVHVLASLGVPNYLATNAVGGLNQEYNVGDMMVIRNHIHRMENPLKGKHRDFKRLDGSRVLRHQPMGLAYDEEFLWLFNMAKEGMKDHVHEGVYLGVDGPTFETDAESLAYMNALGADAVGMSTSPEVIVAHHRGMRVAGVSNVANKIKLNGKNPTSDDEVRAALGDPRFVQRRAEFYSNFFGLYRESRR